MAGKFVSIEEAARLLGVTVDEVRSLVDRKKLFPMRDGASLKFKVEEIEKVAAAFGEESSQSESLALDLDLPTPGSDALALDEAIDAGGGSAAGAGSQTIVRGGATAGSGGLSGLALGDDDDSSSDSGDLALESITGASSPSLGREAAASGSIVRSGVGGDEPLTIDLSGIAGGARGAAAGSQATGALGGASNPSGSGFSAPVDSGLSLEDGGVAASGIDLDAGPMVGSGISKAGGSLVGEVFELGAEVGDEDSASVVIATEGDSIFAAAAEDSVSVAFDQSSELESGSSVMDAGAVYEPTIDMGFSVWQIAGLVCCALVLFTGCLVMYDVAWTLRRPLGTPVSTPLLNALGSAFGWR